MFGDLKVHHVKPLKDLNFTDVVGIYSSIFSVAQSHSQIDEIAIVFFSNKSVLHASLRF